MERVVSSFTVIQLTLMNDLARHEDVPMCQAEQSTPKYLGPEAIKVKMDISLKENVHGLRWPWWERGPRTIGLKGGSKTGQVLAKNGLKARSIRTGLGPKRPKC
jgi:hypothetical protein